MKFKEWLSSSNSEIFKKHLNYVIKCLKSIFIFENYNEDFNKSVSSLPKELYIDVDENSPLYKLIQKYDPNYTPRENHITKKGQEGIALFLTNKIVIKFVANYDEANIALALKGNKNFPVIDVVRYKNLYLIVMHELNRPDNSIKNDLDNANYALYEYISFIEETQKNTDAFNEKTFQDWLLNHNESDLSDKSKKMLIDLFKLVILVIKKTSGYVLGHDWSTDNLGVNKNGKIMPFDLGRSRNYGNANVKKLEIPESE